MSRHLRRIFEERLNRPGYAGGGGLGWNTPSPQPDDYWNQLKAKLPRPSAAAVKEGIKGLFREPTRLTSKYGLAYAPLDVIRNLASILPEGKGLAYGIDEMVDAGVPIVKHEGDELRRAGYNPLQYGLNAVDRAGNAVAGAAEGVPDAVRQAWGYLRSAGEASHDVAGYEAGGPVGTDPPEYTFNTPPSTAGSMPPAKVYADGGKVGEALSAIRKKFGRLQFNRAAEAADTTNLERFSPKGIMDTFDPKNSGLYLSLPPSTFQNYSAYLPTEALTATPYPRWYNMPPSVRKKYASRDDMNLDNYLNEMASHMTSHGADAAPSLWLYRHDVAQDDPIAAALSMRKTRGAIPADTSGTGVEGHEGRHRLMTMARLGDKNSLVHLLPANSGELRFPTDERMSYMLDKYFPQGADTPIVPEYMGIPRQPQSFGAEPFAGGGEVRRKLTTLARDIIGKPSRVKIPGVGDIPASPIKELEDVASQFAKRQGNQYPIDRYPEFDEDRARRIADAYDAMKHNPSDPATARAYDALISETMDQYKALKNAGIDFSFMKPGEQYPYAKSPAQGYMDMLYGRLKVFPTEQGFGTLNDIRDNPLLKKVGPVGDLDDATANDAFRAVHDALGHFGPGNPFFRHKGEDRAFLAHSRAYSPDAIPAAASELRGQNSWLNFGPHGPANRTASEADTIFADQKTGLLPPWAYDDVMPGHADGGPVGFAGGGSVPGYAGGGRKLTRMAEEAMQRLAKLRGERFQNERSMGATEVDARRSANDVFLDPDPKLQRGLVRDPARLAYPGIYKDPRDIASEANDLALEKSPDLGKASSLYRGLGLTRDDLYDYAQSNIDRMPSNIPPQMPGPRQRGSKISDRVLTPENMQHQLDVLRESMNYGNVYKPSVSWYEMGPIWDFAEKRAGLSSTDNSRLNAFMGVHSPASSPIEEMKRGLTANYFLNQGRIDDYVKYGVNTAGTKRLPGYPSDFNDVPGHFAHSTAHIPNLLKAISDPETWMRDADTVKVPHYVAASDPAGPFLERPVADSHIARNLLYPDVRTATRGQQIAKNLTPSEFWDLVPFYKNLSDNMGLKSTPTQALSWNVFGPQTGVRKIAVPKAEMFTDIADERARQRGIGLDQSMIDLLRGEDYPRQYNRGGSIDYDLFHVNNFRRGGPIDYDLFHATHWD